MVSPFSTGKYYSRRFCQLLALCMTCACLCVCVYVSSRVRVGMHVYSFFFFGISQFSYKVHICLFFFFFFFRGLGTKYERKCLTYTVRQQVIDHMRKLDKEQKALFEEVP